MKHPSQATDQELSQARARLFLSAAATLVILLFEERTDGGWGVSQAVRLVGGYTLFSVLWWLFVRRRPAWSKWRQPVVILGDMLATSLGIRLAGDLGAAFYPFYLWIIVGNGMRFGPAYLLGAMGAGVVGFGAVLASTPYWAEVLPLGVGLEVGLVVLPLFYLGLVARLHRLNARLEEELERSRSAVAAKAQFLANMSHELRTPMNGILGLSFLLQDQQAEGPARDYARLIHRSTESLLYLVNDILDFSRLDAEMLRVEAVPFDVGSVLRDTTELLRTKLGEKQLRLELELPDAEDGALVGDPSRLRQIVFNLVGNAIKFTEVGGVKVRCRVERRPEDRRSVTIEVEDTGIGLDAASLERIFEEFEQADDSTSRRFGGSGLGLAISRGLARLMGGDITVASTPGEGATFTLALELPACSPEDVQREARPATARSYGLHALLAEDNRVNQVVARGMLRRLGIEIDLACDGEEAVAMASTFDYDLVFMDLQMPGCSGLDAARALRAKGGRLAALPILALTADATPEARRASREAGMNGHVDKPFTLAAIVRAVDALDLTPGAAFEAGGVSEKPAA